MATQRAWDGPLRFQRLLEMVHLELIPNLGLDDGIDIIPEAKIKAELSMPCSTPFYLIVLRQIKMGKTLNNLDRDSVGLIT